MSNRVQIHVQKQGSIDNTHWSDRTLTIDVPSETASISRRDHPNDLYHHSMHVLGIQKWADMPSTSSGHGHDSAEAKMTLHLMGVKVPPVNFGAEDTQNATNAGAAAGAHAAVPTTQHHPGGIAHDVDSSWMVRCVTHDAYDTAVRMLTAIVQARQTREAGQHDQHDITHSRPMVEEPVVGASCQRMTANAVL